MYFRASQAECISARIFQANRCNGRGAYASDAGALRSSFSTGISDDVAGASCKPDTRQWCRDNACSNASCSSTHAIGQRKFCCERRRRRWWRKLSCRRWALGCCFCGICATKHGRLARLLSVSTDCQLPHEMLPFLPSCAHHFSLHPPQFFAAFPPRACEWPQDAATCLDPFSCRRAVAASFTAVLQQLQQQLRRRLPARVLCTAAVALYQQQVA